MQCSHRDAIWQILAAWVSGWVGESVCGWLVVVSSCGITLGNRYTQLNRRVLSLLRSFVASISRSRDSAKRILGSITASTAIYMASRSCNLRQLAPAHLQSLMEHPSIGWWPVTTINQLRLQFKLAETGEAAEAAHAPYLVLLKRHGSRNVSGKRQRENSLNPEQVLLYGIWRRSLPGNCWTLIQVIVNIYTRSIRLKSEGNRRRNNSSLLA